MIRFIDVLVNQVTHCGRREIGNGVKEEPCFIGFELEIFV